MHFGGSSIECFFSCCLCLVVPLALSPHCITESDQRHAQHPLIMGIDFSCGLYQTTTERIMVLNSWYQIDMSLYSNSYLFVGSKISGRRQPHTMCKTMLFFYFLADAIGSPAQKVTHAEMQIVYPLISQYLSQWHRQRPEHSAWSLWKIYCSGQ